MQKPRPVPFSAPILSLILLLYAGSICAEDGVRKRTPQSIVEQSLSPIETIVIDHSSFAIDPTNIVIDSKTIAPTLPAVTIDHAVISVDKSYDVFVNGSEAIVGIPVPPRTSASQISSSSSKSHHITSSSSLSGSRGLFGSSALSPTSSGSHSAAHVSSRSGSELSDRSTASTRSPSQSLLTGQGTDSLSSKFGETSRLSAQSGLPVHSGSSSRSVPSNGPKSSSIPHKTGRSLSSNSRAASGSQGGSGSGTGNTVILRAPFLANQLHLLQQYRETPLLPLNHRQEAVQLRGQLAKSVVHLLHLAQQAHLRHRDRLKEALGRHLQPRLTCPTQHKLVESLSLHFPAVDLQHRRKDLFSVVFSSVSSAMGAVG